MRMYLIITKEYQVYITPTLKPLNLTPKPLTPTLKPLNLNAKPLNLNPTS
jgi:hypothetical protein